MAGSTLYVVVIRWYDYVIGSRTGLWTIMFSADVLSLLACTSKGAAERRAQALAPRLAGGGSRTVQAPGRMGGQFRARSHTFFAKSGSS